MCPVFERANLAQLVEHHLAKVDVEGSSPLVRSIEYGGVAQLVEQVTLNHWVHGSSPCTPTIKKGNRPERVDFFVFCNWAWGLHLFISWARFRNLRGAYLLL